MTCARFQGERNDPGMASKVAEKQAFGIPPKGRETYAPNASLPSPCNPSPTLLIGSMSFPLVGAKFLGALRRPKVLHTPQENRSVKQ